MRLAQRTYFCVQAVEFFVVCIVFTLAARAASESGGAIATTTLTDAAQFWSLPTNEKSLSHPFRLEGRVSYFDPAWRMLWFERNHVGTYVFLAENPPPLKDGQRLVLEGSIVPDKGLSAEKVKVTVVREYESIVPLSSHSRINDLVTLQGRVVTADGYVDAQQFIDADHVRLTMIVDDRPVVGWVKPKDVRAIPNWAGKFIRVEGVYSARFDPTHSQMTVELWIGAEQNLKVLDSLESSSLFAAAITPISEIHRVSIGTHVHVQGRVDAQKVGVSLDISDATGEITAESLQTAHFPFGTEVEVAGTVAQAGSGWILRSALYRKTPRSIIPTNASNPGLLERADEIRQLSSEQAARGTSVRISGAVTWSLPRTNYFFVQDLSGGIRVHYDAAKFESPALCKYLRIEGVTTAGQFVPVVELQNSSDLGAMNPPAPKLVTFEQAITGAEDGQWVAMRGFYQRTESVGDVRLIHVTTPAGEIVGELHSPVNFAANPGSLIRVLGVCEATVDTAGRTTGVKLRVPFLHSITIEADAPVDFYDLPERSIKTLRRISGAHDLVRVRLIGVVSHAVPGRTVYIEQDGLGLQLLTEQPSTVDPGTKIEAVGILGWERERLVLREAVFRQLGRGQIPLPAVLADQAPLEPALDARLIKVRGRLVDSSRQENYTRLTLQAGTTFFEAILERAKDDLTRRSTPPIGSGLELTGIYRLGFDELAQTRGFTLQLRSPADISVYALPRLWTLQRALLAVGILGGCILLGVAWITALQRRVRQQTNLLREQLERQARLEAEVQRAAPLESLGMLAGGIAHDFNNLLTIIMGNLGLAMLDETTSPSAARHLTEIERGALRAQALTRQLLTFAKGGDPVRLPVLPADITRGAADRAVAGSSIRCEYESAPDLWLANADQEQLAQVVHNLVTNAVEAMPSGGTLRIALSNEQIADGAKKSVRAGRYVRLTITDTGVGIPPEVMPKIFDPYFSTRKTGRGLGLATAYSILKRHEGAIEIHSTVGIGTTVDVWLPAADLPAASQEAKTTPIFAPTERTGKIPRVLLMDDEQSIREIGEKVLRRMGLDPVVVADGAAAVREFSVAQHLGRPFELLILDLTIVGGMGGAEAVELIRKLDPQVPAIVSSGYSSDPVMAHFQEHGFQAMVSKPYEIGQLAGVINHVLNRGKE